jgi:uncharacterized protein YdeI (YjbR/CyaY-like superfamily)
VPPFGAEIVAAGARSEAGLTGVRARAFRDEASFRAWLERNHRTAAELVVRCFKVAHEDRGLTYRQALDEALCHGWIDGVRHGLDDVSFSVRFTPRKVGSVWSRVNVKRAGELRAEGRLRPAGEQAFEKSRTSTYSYESRPQSLGRSLVARFRASEKAWRFFKLQPPWYQRTIAFWVMSARRPETREKRFALLLRCSEAGEAIPQLRRGPRQSSRGGRMSGRGLAKRPARG